MARLRIGDIDPDGELVIPAPKGAGRWIYCKYCHQFVRPLAVTPTAPGSCKTIQIICGDCDYHLTPTYETEDELLREEQHRFAQKKG